MTRERNLKSGSVGSVGSAEFLPAARDLYSRLPETYPLEPWELRHVIFSRLIGRSGRRGVVRRSCGGRAGGLAAVEGGKVCARRRPHCRPVSRACGVA